MIKYDKVDEMCIFNWKPMKVYRPIIVKNNSCKNFLYLVFVYSQVVFSGRMTWNRMMVGIECP